MEIKENHIVVERTARYYSTQHSANKIKYLWFVIHGYAQLAGDFINNFNSLSDSNTLIVAPEALSKFYSRNNIGASWMTKEDRENEIKDYLKYLGDVLKEVQSRHHEFVGANLLGFSQGVHTAVRLFINNDFHFNNLILHSSDFPKDADFPALKQKLKNSKMYYIYGRQDRAITLESFQDSKKLLKANRIPFETIEFDGGHVIHEDSLKEFNK